jgi:hypothetical protein
MLTPEQFPTVAPLFNAARVLIPFIIAFAIGLMFAPLLSHFLYK